jgi:hypothetical protein
LGDVVNELDTGLRGNAQPAEHYDDQQKLNVVRAEKNIHLFLNMHAFRVEKQADRIVAVVARHTQDSGKWRFTAPIFADCTGDGTLGFLAGAEYRMGRESKDHTAESPSSGTLHRHPNPQAFLTAPGLCSSTKKAVTT